MKLFVYEHVTGGGLLDTEDLPVSLLQEGRAMVSAMVADFSRLRHVETLALCDHRVALKVACSSIQRVDSLAAWQAAFDQLAADADLTLVIAPEIDGALLKQCQRVRDVHGRLLGPDLELVALCSDKQRTAEYLRAAGVPVPRGMAIRQGDALPADFPYPAVIKPLDGCGSQGVQRIESAAEAAAIGVVPWPVRLEAYCPGMAASVAVLCGGGRFYVLPPCRQRLSSDGRFAYLGGELPLPPDLARRASELALRAVRTLPDPSGYVGVDLILGETESETVANSRSNGDSPIFANRTSWSKSYVAVQKLGQSPADVVIEINPRLTTSYVGLRAACRGNLAEAMLKIAQGQPAELSFRDDPLQFDADGTVRFLQGKL